MRIGILRHAHAQDHSSTGLDADRALSDQGRAEAAWVAERFRARNHPPFDAHPSLIITSGVRRADETAALIAAHMNAPIEGSRALALDQPTSEFLDLIRIMIQRSQTSLLTVGHNPQLSNAVRFLFDHSSNPADAPHLSLPLATAQIAGFELEPGSRFMIGDDDDLDLQFLGSFRPFDPKASR